MVTDRDRQCRALATTVTVMEGTDTAESSTDDVEIDSIEERPVTPADNRHPAVRLVAFCVVCALILAGVVVYGFTHAPRWKRTGPPITVAGWAPYWQSDSARASFNANVSLFNEVSMFAYSTTKADSVTPFVGVDPNAPLVFRRDARAAGVKFVASIVDATKPHEMAAILADPASRSLHVQTIVTFVNAGGFDGVDLDYENFAFNDGKETWATTRPNWVAFLSELSAALHASGKTLTVSVPPVYDAKTTDDSGYWVYDYAAMGKVVDHLRIMAYDFSTTDPGPIAPLPWVKNLVKAAKSLVPSDRLVLGVPVYGYDWPGATVGTCPADGKPRRRNLTTKAARDLATSKGIVPTWDPIQFERTFTYNEQVAGVDAAGLPVTCTVSRTVWFADDEAVYNRAWVAERQDLAGISLWSLGSDDPSVWAAIGTARADVSTWPTTVASTTGG
jgi:spore germination protein YaaH